MQSKVKFLGHAIHPILIVFPLGLLITGVVFDIVYQIWGDPDMARVSFWMISAGIIGGIVAAPFGLIDWLSIPSGTRARMIGAVHGLTNALALLLFIGSWWVRYEAPARPSVTASILSLVGLAMAAVGGWLGGELVERLGVGVDEGANLDAPNSLTHETVRSGRGSAASPTH